MSSENEEKHDVGPREPTTHPGGLVKFVRTKGTPVAGKYRDKAERISGTVSELRLACEGAYSLSERSAPSDRAQWFAALARACSVFLRKMVIGDRDDPATRLLDDEVLETLGMRFDKLKRIVGDRQTLEVVQSISGGRMEVQKLDETTRRPVATETLALAPQTLKITVEWPLAGAASWKVPPTEDRPWTIAPEELFEMGGKHSLDCSGWLGQQLVMFDQRGITLKDVIRMVATYEGAHSINVSRLLQAEEQEDGGPFRHPQRHILDNVTVFEIKYSHIVVIESALYLHEKLVDEGHVKQPSDEEWRVRLSFVTLEEEGFFSANQKWLGFAGGLILAFGTEEQLIAHRIRAVGK